MELVTKKQNNSVKNSPCAVALGFFDGVHIGHAAVINQMLEYAKKNALRPAVFTFTQQGGAAPKGQTIMTPAQKHRQLENMGVATCYEPPFSSFSTLSPQDFFHAVLVGEFNANAIFCGEDFAFGANRAGSATILKELCHKQSIHFATTPTTMYKGEAVSSTRIKAALAQGNIEDANAMLGRPYEIELTVQHGKQLGTKLGFPTANQIFPPGLAQPAFGVYASIAVVNGAQYPAATGFGTRPTVDGGAPSCETFIPGFSGQLYNNLLRIHFYKKLANTQKFAGLNELSAAVQQWAQQAQEYFKTTPPRPL